MLKNEIKYGQKKKNQNTVYPGFLRVSQNIQKLGKYVASASSNICNFKSFLQKVIQNIISAYTLYFRFDRNCRKTKIIIAKITRYTIVQKKKIVWDVNIVIPLIVLVYKANKTYNKN